MDYLSNLPNELLINIFDYCKIVPLTLTSSKFNKLISNSPTLMKKLNLIITEKTKTSEIMKSDRKFNKIKINFNYKIDDSILKLCEKFSDDIKSIEFVRCICTEGLFVNILKSLVKLRTLSLYTTYLKSNIEIEDYEKSSLSATVKLNNLKELNFRNSDIKILNLLANSNTIVKLNLSLPHQYPAWTVKSFLEAHDKVEVIENIMVSEVDDFLLSFILCDLKYLKKLCLEIESIKMEAVRNLQIENSSIEFLNLYGSPSNPLDFNIILKFFKNLKHLEVEINNVLEAVNISQLNSSIESLIIKNCSGDFFNHIAISNLKFFEISDVSFSITQNDWINFANRNPKLETLKIKDESVSDEIFISICQQFRNLMQLEMFYDPQRLTNEILNFISNETLFPRNIKILKIYQRNRYQGAIFNSHFDLTNYHKDSLKTNYGFQLILK